MKKYRVTFSSKSGRDDDARKYDIEAESSNEAFREAFKRLKADVGDWPYSKFSDGFTEEIPTGITNVGIRFRYKEKTGHSSCQYMVIRAENEKQAIEFYNKTLRGKAFYQPWPTMPDNNGNCIYGEVAETYFAACPGYDYDATAS